jgi:tetratricopeptide (TPR) repeat protein
MVGHPLWNIAARLFCLLPLGELPYRLNLFSALCGAGVVYLLFRLVTLILYEVMSEEHWIRQIDVELLPEALLTKAAQGEGVNDTGHRIAMAGGAASALAMAFCAPFWLASTSLHAQTFELLIFLSAGYALVRYWAASSVLFLALAGFLLGLGVVESVVCLVFLPVALFYFLSGAFRHDHITVSFFVLVVLCFAFGLLLACAAQVAWIAHGEFSTRVLIKIAAMWFQGQADALRSMFVRKGWLVMVAQGFLPLLIVYAGRHHFAYNHLLNPRMVEADQDHERTNVGDHRVRLSELSWSMVFLLLLGCVVHALWNLPGSPWYFSRGSTHVPVLPLLGIAMTLGFLLSYSLILGRQCFADPAKDSQKTRFKTPIRMACVVRASMIIMMCALLATVVLVNRGEVDGRKSCFVDLFCREILKAAPEASCFVTEGTFDMNLLVQARLLNRPITLLNLRDMSQGASSSSGGAGAKQTTAAEFLRAWLSAHPEACSQVAILTAPGLWFDAGFQAIPNKLVYLGVKPEVKIDLAAAVKDHTAFWKTSEPLLGANLPRSSYLFRLQSQLRTQASRLANDLGVLCLHKASIKEAQEAFKLALVMDPQNLCAWVNQWAPDGLTMPAKKGKPQAALLEQFSPVMRDRPAFGSLSAYEQLYGALYFPAVEQLAHLSNGGLDAEDTLRCSAVLKLACDYVRSALQTTAEPRTPKAASLKEGSIDEEVMNVVKALAGGYSKAAENQLRNLLRTRRTSLVSWALLAEALMNQKNFAEVQNTLLPEMRFLAGDKGSEWLDLTEGCLALRQGKPDYRVAHEHFKRALQRNPDIEEAQNLLIQTALSLGDQAMVEADCTAVLKQSRHQPLANATLGVLRLNQNRLEDAEQALNSSIASQPTAVALNDLGETWRRMQRLQAAEGVTRRALLLQPEFCQAWDTLALILKDQGRLDEAAEAHRKALRLCQTDIRLFLNAAKLEQARGDFKAVRRLLKDSEPLLAGASINYKDTYRELLKSPPQ